MTSAIPEEEIFPWMVKHFEERKNLVNRLFKIHISIRTLLGELFLSFISIPFSFSRFQFIRNPRIVKHLEIQSY